MKAGLSLPRLRVRFEDLASTPLVFAVLGYAVAYGVRHPDFLATLVVGGAALVVAVLAWRYPFAGLTAVVVAYPFQALVQGWMFKHGVPVRSLTLVGYWKELVLGIVVLRAWQQRANKRGGPVEVMAGALLALVVVYVLLPIGVPDLQARYVAARSDVGFIVVFLAARWLITTSQQRDRLERALLASISVIAALGLWNYFDQVGWKQWVEGTGLREFQQTLNHAEPPLAVVKVAFGDSEVVRVGSIFLSANTLGYTLLVGIAIAVSRMIRGAGGKLERLAVVLCVFCLVPTFCRSAIALLLVLALVLAAGAGRLSRSASVIGVSAIVLAILLATIGQASGQVASGFDTEDPRTAAHIERLTESAGHLVSDPLGSGLATATAVAIRFDIAGGVTTPENFYLGLGAEIGVLGVALMLGFVIVTWQMLWRRVRLRGDLHALAPAGAIAVLAIGGMVLGTFAIVSAAWPAFALAGAALSHEDEDEDEPPSAATRRQGVPPRPAFATARPL